MINKEKVLNTYLEWVDHVLVLTEKTHFTLEEIVFKVCDIVGENSNKWVSVHDRLPEDKPNDPNIFITCDKDGFVYGNSQFFGGDGVEKDGFYSLLDGYWVYDIDVMYWMALPMGAY